MTTFDEALNAGAVEVVESLARQDARTPRDAAVASLGPHATEAQIADWIATYRPAIPHAQPA